MSSDYPGDGIDVRNPPSSDSTKEREIRLAKLEAILMDAVDTDALKKILADFGFEQTIINKDAVATAYHAMFRQDEIDGTPYILCPVPFLYDEKRQMEAGFAIDVDQDHFSVFAYLHDYLKNRSLVVSKLPHCVYRAIAIDAYDYSSVYDEIKALSNELSAKFFINSLATDLAVHSGSPIEFFDDKLYLQLLNRFVKVSDPSWINHVVIEKKFNQLMAQFDQLDVNEDFYQNNKLRVYINITQYLSGVSDLVSSNYFARYLERNAIRKHEHVIHAYLESKDFLQFFLTFKSNYMAQLQSLLLLYARGGLKISLDFSTNILDAIYKRAATDNKLLELLNFIALHDIEGEITLYQRAAIIAEASVGPDHPETKAIKSKVEEFEKLIARRSNITWNDIEATFNRKMEAISWAAAENIPFDYIDLSRVSKEDIVTVQDGIALLREQRYKVAKIATASTWFRLGRLFDKMECTRDSAFCYQAAIMHCPNHSLAHSNQGIQYEKIGDSEGAKKLYKRANKTNPYNPHGLNGLGAILEAENRIVEAEKCYRKALSLKKVIETNPALVETRIAPAYWDTVKKNLDWLLKMKK